MRNPTLLRFDTGDDDDDEDNFPVSFHGASKANTRELDLLYHDHLRTMGPNKRFHALFNDKKKYFAKYPAMINVAFRNWILF